MSMKPIVLAAGLATLPGLAFAHVAATPNTTTAGAYTAVAFRVGHGCDGKATTQLRLEVPAAIAQARPRALPGWKLTIEKDAAGRLSAMVWRGKLPDERFESFEVLFKAPDQSGPLFFPAIQTCVGAEQQWIEVPADGSPAGSHPAPVVTVVPVGGAAAAHH